MLRSWWCWYVESHVDDGGGGSHNDDDFEDVHDVFVHCDVHGYDYIAEVDFDDDYDNGGGGGGGGDDDDDDDFDYIVNV